MREGAVLILFLPLFGILLFRKEQGEQGKEKQNNGALGIQPTYLSLTSIRFSHCLDGRPLCLLGGLPIEHYLIVAALDSHA